MNGPKSENVEMMFDAIAADYDSLNHILSLNIDRKWRRKAIPLIADRSRDQTILDIACGTGDFSIEIARKISDRSFVTGIDLSEGMLSVMRHKVSRALMENKVSCQQCNAESLPFDESSFDVATIAFGIRNFEHREAALKEILRVLKPGGRLVILELSVPTVPLVDFLYKFYFLKILPFIGGKVSGEKAAYHYLPASVLAFPGKDEWMGTMRACGYVKVDHKAFSLGICRMYSGEKEL